MAPREVLQLDPPVANDSQDQQCFAQQHLPALRALQASSTPPRKKLFGYCRSASSMPSRKQHIALTRIFLPTKSPSERKKGLDANGLLEHFLEPRLSYFLEGEE
ncbi:hypothetical protein D16iCDA_03585 [Pseudomonas seleniipraecipitans]|uniref:Uncharacterized protein n=1 Tax=Phytopseudomonas seleniipraecipitans TaxID=640205 RepID=A0ABY5J9Q2_9GAMM|nr:hypothetical protein [Pseudomonas seleniipraecipitans]UUD64791.1 hypothetical protein D16iCDA_03585 [Pseudomonas seleniipraecipitans]